MNQKETDILIDRLNNILHALRLQNSACDVHTIGNLRNTATMLIDQLQTDPDCLNEDLAKQITKNLESKLVEFFKNKYI